MFSLAFVVVGAVLSYGTTSLELSLLKFYKINLTETSEPRLNTIKILDVNPKIFFFNRIY